MLRTLKAPDIIAGGNALIELRKMTNLSDEVFERMPRVYGSVLPGYGTKASEVKGDIFYVIGLRVAKRI